MRRRNLYAYVSVKKQNKTPHQLAAGVVKVPSYDDDTSKLLRYMFNGLKLIRTSLQQNNFDFTNTELEQNE